MRISDWSSDVCSSDLDDIISVDNTRKLAKAVEKAGGPVETLIYPKLSHDMAINAFASLFSDRYDVLKQVSDFIRRKSSGQVTPRPSAIRAAPLAQDAPPADRKSTRLNSSH